VVTRGHGRSVGSMMSSMSGNCGAADDAPGATVGAALGSGAGFAVPRGLAPMPPAWQGAAGVEGGAGEAAVVACATPTAKAATRPAARKARVKTMARLLVGVRDASGRCPAPPRLGSSSIHLRRRLRARPFRPRSRSSPPSGPPGGPPPPAGHRRGSSLRPRCSHGTPERSSPARSRRPLTARSGRPRRR